MRYHYFCKRCGESKSFDSKKERDSFKEQHRPKNPMLKGVRMYACSLVQRRHKGGFILRRSSAQ
jgi:hypothetical protein